VKRLVAIGVTKQEFKDQNQQQFTHIGADVGPAAPILISL
jgi:hypothetical protein